jgi:hypothetical protein
VWDSDVVAPLLRRRTPAEVARALLADLDPAQATRWAAATDPIGWAEESNREARAIYDELGRSPGDGRLDALTPRDYEAAQRARVERCLARAGVRLAAALNRIARERPAAAP